MKPRPIKSISKEVARRFKEKDFVGIQKTKASYQVRLWYKNKKLYLGSFDDLIAALYARIGKEYELGISYIDTPPKLKLTRNRPLYTRSLTKKELNKKYFKAFKDFKKGKYLITCSQEYNINLIKFAEWIRFRKCRYRIKKAYCGTLIKKHNTRRYIYSTDEDIENEIKGLIFKIRLELGASPKI